MTDFDPAAVAAEMHSGGSSGAGYLPGEFPEPARPLMPPAGADLPAAVAASLKEYTDAHTAWERACDAVSEYQETARISRVRREDAIRAAGQAVAQGKPRPKIPAEVSEADEATEVKILAAVVADRRMSANRASRALSDAVIAHAPEFVAPLTARFAPAIEAIREKAGELRRMVEAAEGTVSGVARYRALSHVGVLRKMGASVSDAGVASLVGEYSAAVRSPADRLAAARGRSPLHLLIDMTDAVNGLADAQLDAMPHPDTLGVVGVDGAAQRAAIAEMKSAK
ncbi:hypothetical protein ACFY2R_17095 [Micromonospora olivasterospora]|uniref:Uncharacterized protein n=1 Tax=Micromonospora olivasterospora TaxID=1880 RepID=A0A562ICV6_MICOL|nr:hypothetical protein [Micromonospora olivasterospora]TWH68454.1 hypothetical protein JD77_03447 [Micromonospora olivasterospora]